MPITTPLNFQPSKAEELTSFLSEDKYKDLTDVTVGEREVPHKDESGKQRPSFIDIKFSYNGQPQHFDFQENQNGQELFDQWAKERNILS